VLQQQFDIGSARRDVHAPEAQLALAIGISPASLPEVASLSALPLPEGLPASVDSMLQQAVSTRPDLAAQFADVRAREAELERVRADYRPKLSANGTLGRVYRELDSINLRPNGATFYPKRTTAGVGLELSWELFDGFIWDNRVREPKVRRDQARADLDALQLASEAQVWTVYADFQSALSQHQFAVALVATTKSGYDSALVGYGSGITNFVDLPAAERDYTRALAVEVGTRAANFGQRRCPRLRRGNNRELVPRCVNYRMSITHRTAGIVAPRKRVQGRTPRRWSWMPAFRAITKTPESNT
jgi:outer membrane protein TolC